MLFANHPLINHLAEKLLHVFVSIEMTGQSVQFEQKFNYRRPMYLVLEYIWEKENHRNAIKVPYPILKENRGTIREDKCVKIGFLPSERGLL